MDSPQDHECSGIVAAGVSRRVALRRIGGGLAAVSAVAAVARPERATGAPAGRATGKALATPAGQSPVDPFVGSWTYRSFVNDPDPAQQPDQLLFGQGELAIDAFAPGSFGGRLVLEGGGQLNLAGASSFGNPFAVRFQGVGEEPPVEGWVYDYVGYLVPTWPNGVDQRPAIVGSVVRTVPHDGNPAGFVASWIAVKRD
jgi:hypothetical protein